LLDRPPFPLNRPITPVILIRKIISALIATGLVTGTVYLGIQSGKDNRFVVWFGIASATAAPVGLALFGYAISRSDDEIIQRLSKVPEIERLIEQAKTQEEKIQVLEVERSRLAEIVKIESRRQAALDRIDSLERDAVRILAELENLDRELILIDEQVGESAISEEIRRLRERVKAREDGDVILRLGSRVYRINRDIIKALPFGLGNPLIAYFRIAEKLEKTLLPKMRR
jgi:predicted XRE-type DNA-binding protein